MYSTKFLSRLFSFLMIASLFFSAIGTMQAQAKGTKPPTPTPTAPGDGSIPAPTGKRITVEDRQAAADANLARGFLPGVAGQDIPADVLDPNGVFNSDILNAPQTSPIDETVIPHYYGPYANYANSPMPKGAILDITVDAPGSGYSASPNVIITDVYGTGSGATAEAVVDPGTGGILSILVTDPGVGYTAPIVVITDLSGSGAAATPNLDPATLSGGIRKFVDEIAGLTPAGASSTLGNYISLAHPDTITFPGADYYEIELIQYTQQLHSDLPPTTLRGYHQVNNGTDLLGANTIAPDPVMYLGTTIVAQRNRPVRIKFMNHLGTGTDGDLFIPVDPNVMGAGLGPKTADGLPCDPEDPAQEPFCTAFTQNRATLHLHGGLVPWISDGTPHQWITPAGETTQYPTGVSVRYVPDMWYDANGQVVPGTEPGQIVAPGTDLGGGVFAPGDITGLTAPFTTYPGDGSLTFYYNNQQSARLQFYHDHAYGITRLNVYAGEVAGYLVTDEVEQDLINGTNDSGVNPGGVHVFGDMSIGIPLILQDKSFVDETTIIAQDPTWRWGTGTPDPITGRRAPKTGDLWVSSVYMPVQNPWDTVAGANAYGRWQYGPWFWPPTENVTHGPVANEYYDPNCDPMLVWCEPPMRPASSMPSMGMEAYNDTQMVNGVAYPYMDVDPKPYRFRILNGANDRFYNLQMYVADPAVTSSDGRTNTEVKMVDALIQPGYPETFPNDGRAGGAPDPTMAGPAWIQIGTEGGFLPAPVVIENQAITWNMNPGLFNVGNVLDHSLLLGNAERADVIVDFTPYAGKTIILYNDAPTAFPALDPRYDYYTGNPPQMDSGGTPPTLPGFGPNTRTVMQFRVSGTPAAGVLPTNYYDPAVLDRFNTAWAKNSAGGKLGVFEAGAEPIIVPQAVYNSAYEANFPIDAYAKITDRTFTFVPLGQTSPVTFTFEEKAIHDEMGATYDPNYGHMGGMLGLELPGTNNLTQNIILYGYASPPTDVLRDSGFSQIGSAEDGTQFWKITHNGVDTHPIHIHLTNAQLINRVGWDGLFIAPDANELGWKETIRVNPLESTILAMRPAAPIQPFELPDSIRLIEPARPSGVDLMGPPGGFKDPALNGINVPNHLVNFGWEYVWHCHILSHEEMDMMHSLVLAVAPWAPTGLAMGTPGDLTWNDNSIAETGQRLERATDAAFSQNLETYSIGANATTFTDPTYVDGVHYYYRLFADNTVGDSTVYPTSVGFPTETVSSVSNTLELNPITTVVVSGNTGTGGVTLSYTDGVAMTVVSDATGAYSITVPSGWSGTVTPSKTGGYTFAPVSRLYTPIAVDQTAQDYSMFGKSSPASGAIGQAASPALSWTAFTGATSYDYCADQSNDTTCDPAGATSTGWVNTTNLSESPALANGATYYWQVRADGATQANGGAWWSLNTQPGAFDKLLPANGALLPDYSTSATLTWQPSTGATAYYYCFDLTSNATCDTPWVRAGTSTSAALTGLTRGKTYHWQVRAEYATAPVLANGGTWFSFNTRPVLGPGTYDDANVNWVYASAANNWSTSVSASAYSGGYHTSNRPGGTSTATIVINTQRFSIMTTNWSLGGELEVFVDGVSIGTINTYSATTKWQQWWDSPVLATGGAHTIRLVHKTGGYAILDAIKVWSAPYTIPAAITNLSAVTGTPVGSVDLAWTAVGADKNVGTATSYDVRYSSAAITGLNWASALPLPAGNVIPTPLVAGSPQSMTVTGLTPNVQYFFAVRAINNVGGTGLTSNSPSAFAKFSGLTAGTYQQNNPYWIYTSPANNWVTGNSALASGGSYVNSNRTTSAATIVISGASFNLIYTRWSLGGVIEVFIDNVSVGTINTYNATTQWQQSWSSGALTPGSHTVRLVHLSGSYAILDAIQIQ